MQKSLIIYSATVVFTLALSEVTLASNLDEKDFAEIQGLSSQYEKGQDQFYTSIASNCVKEANVGKHEEYLTQLFDWASRHAKEKGDNVAAMLEEMFIRTKDKLLESQKGRNLLSGLTESTGFRTGAHTSCIKSLEEHYNSYKDKIN